MQRYPRSTKTESAGSNYEGLKNGDRSNGNKKITSKMGKQFLEV